MQKISTCLWFDDKAEEAANFYVSIFKNSKIGITTRYDAASAAVSGKQEGTVLTVGFVLDGVPFMALNGGPLFKFSEAISFVVDCEDQTEIDYFWEKLTEGGEESQCGWLKDKFGVSWQIVPTELPALLAASEKAVQAMLTMKKLDIETLKKAAE
jgi:predicted 3-demethylubiquinone-9 3-methyltransferase (glyoxalase superfamily)